METHLNYKAINLPACAIHYTGTNLPPTEATLRPQAPQSFIGVRNHLPFKDTWTKPAIRSHSRNHIALALDCDVHESAPLTPCINTHGIHFNIHIRWSRNVRSTPWFRQRVCRSLVLHYCSLGVALPFSLFCSPIEGFQSLPFSFHVLLSTTSLYIGGWE